MNEDEKNFDNIYDTIQSCARQYADLEKGIEVAEKKIRALPEFDRYQKYLITQAIRSLYHDYRHEFNTEVKKNAKKYGGMPKVDMAKSKIVKRIANECYYYCIAGRFLGDLYGKELMDIAKTEQAIANGHIHNVRLCKKLKKLVGDEQLVKDAVKPTTLLKLFKEVGISDKKKEKVQV